MCVNGHTEHRSGMSPHECPYSKPLVLTPVVRWEMPGAQAGDTKRGKVKAALCKTIVHGRKVEHFCYVKKNNPITITLIIPALSAKIR